MKKKENANTFILQTSCVRHANFYTQACRRSQRSQAGSRTLPVVALANGRHRFLQLFLYLFILFMSRDEWTTITQSNRSLGASLLLRGRHFFAIPANKTVTAGQPVTNVAQVITVSCLFQYDLILLCDKTAYLYPFLMSWVDLNKLGGKCLNPRL